MGNQSSICTQCSSRHFHQLCSLITQNYNDPYQLSFSPFGPHFSPCSQNAATTFEQNQEIPVLAIPVSAIPVSAKRISEGEETGTMLGHLTESVPSSQASLSNNWLNADVVQTKAILGERTAKHKQIKKAQKPKRRQPISEDAHQLNASETTHHENTTHEGQTAMRNQNNCKSYHKLVKNYLEKKGLAYLFDDYKVQYHTRYFFVVALIFIKYCLPKIDFNEVYAQIVRNELQSQNQKISKMQLQKEKIEEKMRKIGSSSTTSKELMLKKQELVKKINHLLVVKHEIEVYSTGSCSAFFQGNTQKSLRILYQKNDPVMKKTSYFNSALQIVKTIQYQVRKQTSF